MCVCVCCYCCCSTIGGQEPRRKLHHTRTCWYIFCIFPSTSFFYLSFSFFLLLFFSWLRLVFVFVSNFIFERFWPLPDFLFSLRVLSAGSTIYILHRQVSFVFLVRVYKNHPPFPAAQSKRIDFLNSFSIPWGRLIRLVISSLFSLALLCLWWLFTFMVSLRPGEINKISPFAFIHIWFYIRTRGLVEWIQAHVDGCCHSGK